MKSFTISKLFNNCHLGTISDSQEKQQKWNQQVYSTPIKQEGYLNLLFLLNPVLHGNLAFRRNLREGEGGKIKSSHIKQILSNDLCLRFSLVLRRSYKILSSTSSVIRYALQNGLTHIKTRLKIVCASEGVCNAKFRQMQN